MTDPFAGFTQDDDEFGGFADEAIDAFAVKQPVPMPSDTGVGFNRPRSVMTPERKLIEGLGFKFPDIERAPGYRPGELMASATRGPEYGMEYSPNPVLRTGGEVVRGATAPGRKLEQLFAYLKNKTGVSTPDQYQLDKARMAAEEAAYQSRGNAQIPFLNQSPAELVGGMGSMPNPNIGRLPGKMLTEEGMRQAGAVMGKSALAGSAYGQLQPVENRSEDDFLSQNTAQGIAGGLAAPGLQLTAEKVAAPVGKGLARIFGKGTPGQDVRKIGERLMSASSNMDDDVATLKALLSSDVKGIPERAGELMREAKSPSALTRSKRVRLSSQIQELKEKSDVGSLYVERNKLADEIGAKVDRKKIGDAIRQSILEAEEALDDKTVAYLKKMQKKLDSGEIKNDFVSMDKFRSVIGDELRSHYGGKETVTGSRGVAALQPVKKAITAAMDDSASIYGSGLKEITIDARTAKKAYQNKWQDPTAVQVHGKLPVEAGTMQYGDTPSDEIVNKFAYQGEAHGQELGERAERATGLFTDSGKRGVKSILFDAAKAKANGDPSVFLKELDQPGVRKFFDGQDLEALDGLRKILSASESMGQTSATLGMGAAGYGLGSMGGHEALGTLAGLSTGAVGGRFRGIQIPEKFAAGGWMKLLSSPAGQRLLLQAKRAEGPALKAVLDNVTKFMATTSATPENDKLKSLLKGQKQ